jgi:hypothetical protein
MGDFSSVPVAARDSGVFPLGVNGCCLLMGMIVRMMVMVGMPFAVSSCYGLG